MMESIMRNIQILRQFINFSFGIVGVFFNIFIYSVFKSVELTIISSMIMYLGVLIGFSLFGYYFAKYKMPSKYTFAAGLFLAAMSYTILLFKNGDVYSTQILFVFLSVYGITQGIVHNGLNSLELYQVNINIRDEYVAKIGFINKVISIVNPIIASLAFYFLPNYGYAILFTMSCVSFVGAAVLSLQVSKFIPQPIKIEEVRYFYLNYKHLYVHIYSVIDGMSQILKEVLFPITSILILKNESNVGIFNTVFSFISLFLMYLGVKFRNKDNSKKIHLWATLLYIPFIVLFIFHTSYVTFSILILSGLIFSPQINVSRHVLDLHTMNMTSISKDLFYASSLLREVNLFIGRALAGILFIWLVGSSYLPIFDIKVGYAILVFTLIVRVLAGDFMLKKSAMLNN